MLSRRECRVRGRKAFSLYVRRLSRSIGICSIKAETTEAGERGRCRFAAEAPRPEPGKGSRNAAPAPETTGNGGIDESDHMKIKHIRTKKFKKPQNKIKQQHYKINDTCVEACSGRSLCKFETTKKIGTANIPVGSGGQGQTPATHRRNTLNVKSKRCSVSLVIKETQSMNTISLPFTLSKRTKTSPTPRVSEGSGTLRALGEADSGRPSAPLHEGRPLPSLTPGTSLPFSLLVHFSQSAVSLPALPSVQLARTCSSQGNGVAAV